MWPIAELKLEASDEFKIGCKPVISPVGRHRPGLQPGRANSRRGPLRLGLRHWPAAEEGGGFMRYTGSCRGGGAEAAESLWLKVPPLSSAVR